MSFGPMERRKGAEAVVAVDAGPAEADVLAVALLAPEASASSSNRASLARSLCCQCFGKGANLNSPAKGLKKPSIGCAGNVGTVPSTAGANG